MGVHTTFVRSVDLDEWTQRQIDAMKLGGNANANQYFRKHGLTDGFTKIEKKYTSKAAQSYRGVLSKLVDAEAAKRGETTAAVTADGGQSNGQTSLMDTLDELDQKEAQSVAAAPAAPTVAKAVQASQLPGASKLRTPALRKPANSGTTSINLLKKKPKKTAGSALRIGKLSTNSSTVSNGTSASATTEMSTFEAPTPDPVPEVTKTLQATSITSPVSPTSPSDAPKRTMADNIAKMKADNMDFFGGL